MTAKGASRDTATTQPVLPLPGIRPPGGASPQPASSNSSVMNSGSVVPSASASNVKGSPSGPTKKRWSDRERSCSSGGSSSGSDPSTRSVLPPVRVPEATARAGCGGRLAVASNGPHRNRTRPNRRTFPPGPPASGDPAPPAHPCASWNSAFWDCPHFAFLPLCSLQYCGLVPTYYPPLERPG